jgi:hypothetical protein
MRTNTIGCLIFASIWSTPGSFGTAFAQNDTVVSFHGMCDASAAVALDANNFVVANDEDNVIRVYSHTEPKRPRAQLDVSTFLGMKPTQEADIEAATRIGDRVYWITSHGRNSEGQERPRRQRLFATDIQLIDGQVTIKPAGAAYEGLLNDLIKAPQLAKLKLAAAAGKKPEAQGGFNIEGLASTPGGELWIGFRNPLFEGKALIVPLINATQLLTRDAATARFGEPLFLALGGRGIRSIEYSAERHEYLIAAGPFNGKGNFALYRWSGKAAETPRQIPNVSLGTLRPEAMAVYPGNPDKIQVLSDDGDETIDGSRCKDNPDAGKRRFRSTWITLPQK